MTAPRICRPIVLLGARRYNEKHPNEECVFCEKPLGKHTYNDINELICPSPSTIEKRMEEIRKKFQRRGR